MYTSMCICYIIIYAGCVVNIFVHLSTYFVFFICCIYSHFIRYVGMYLLIAFIHIQTSPLRPLSHHITPTGESYGLTCTPHVANLGDLHSQAHHFLTEELALATRTTYHARQKYIHFCTIAMIPHTPATDSTMLLFISHLATVNISHATIKVYICHMHILYSWST